MSEENKSNAPINDLETEWQTRLHKLDEVLEQATSKLQAISELVATAESSASSMAEKIAEMADTATKAIAVKTQIADDQAVIATKSAHIQKAQEHADKVRSDLDRVLTATMQQQTEAEGLKSRAQAAADAAAELLISVKTTNAAAEKEGNSVANMRAEAETAVGITKSLADKSTMVEQRLTTYETQLNDIKSQSEQQLHTITGLLPGAASAGLAHAFDQRRQTFLKPSRRWQYLFVGSIVALVCLAFSGLWNVYKAAIPLSYDELFRLWLARFPIAGALVWLAIHAGRESALAKRLEEDYGYKSAIASSFMGFHKQMLEIGEKAGTNEPLAQLCTDTLTTIASPPGRIYDKHELIVSPTTETRDIVKNVAQVGGAMLNAPK